MSLESRPLHGLWVLSDQCWPVDAAFAAMKALSRVESAIPDLLICHIVLCLSETGLLGRAWGRSDGRQNTRVGIRAVQQQLSSFCCSQYHPDCRPIRPSPATAASLLTLSSCSVCSTIRVAHHQFVGKHGFAEMNGSAVSRKLCVGFPQKV